MDSDVATRIDPRQRLTTRSNTNGLLEATATAAERARPRCPRTVRSGTLFLVYLDDLTSVGGPPDGIVVLRSADGGATFSVIGTLAIGDPDQPAIAVGPGPTAGSGSVWVTFRLLSGTMVAAGAPVSG